MSVPYMDQKRAVLWSREALFKAEDGGLISPQLRTHIQSVLCIEWSGRMNRTLGYARYRKSEAWVQLSIILWAACPEEEKRETVFHEMAHIIANAIVIHDPGQVQKSAGHGPAWRRVMRVLGYKNAARCHSVTNEEHEKTKGNVPLYCACSANSRGWVSKDRGLRLLLNKAWCRTCKAKFKVPKEYLSLMISGLDRRQNARSI